MDPYIEQLINEFVLYLYERAAWHDIYVLSGQGESVVDILPKIPDKENQERTKQILTKIKENLYAVKADPNFGFSMYLSKAFDCSGLGTEWFLQKGLIKSDTTANGLYLMCDEISFDDLRPGDAVFQESLDATGKPYQHHIGYIVSREGNKISLIEAKGRKYGVVESRFTTSNWDHAGRFKFWNVKPVQKTLTRELYLTDPMMRGDDVKMVQEELINRKYNPGPADGIFGKNTEIAVKNFQTDIKLDIKRYGTVGKKTAEALGFVWEG